MDLWDVIEPPAWMADAACAGADTDLFYPEAGDYRAAERAKAVCARCPVIDDCLRHALTSPVEQHGVWGGLTPNERSQLRRRRKDAA